MRKTTIFMMLLLAAASLFTAQAATRQPGAAKKKVAALEAAVTEEPTTHSDPPPTPAPVSTPVKEETSARVIQYGEKDLITLATKIRYTTLIVLPEKERILDFVCGDKEFWVVNGNQNMAYIKPAKIGATTNLNLITASGRIYTFVLNEVSEKTGAEPDLKVFVEPKEQSMISSPDSSPRFVAASELDNYRVQLEIAKQETDRVKQMAQSQLEGEIPRFLESIHFTYRFDKDKKPFRIKAIWHDKKFTYIQGEPDETPTLYEVRDGQANLINFELRNGLYIADKVIDRGYLAIGKYRLLFVKHD